MAYYVYSTLSQDNLYVTYQPGVKKFEARIIDSRILIKGGTGVINKHFVTPKGVVTKITDEQYELLMGKDPKDLKQGCISFKRHVEKGFLIIQKSNTNPEKVAKDMEEKDMGAVATLDDIQKRGAPDAKPVA